MQDAESGEPKKTFEKRKHLSVVNELNESIGATTITKRILDLGVNLTICKLLVLALAIEKQFTKAITEDESVQFWINTLESSTVNAWKAQSWYSMSSPKAKVRPKGSSQVTVFLDTGMKINVMTKQIIKDTGLALW